MRHRGFLRVPLIALLVGLAAAPVIATPIVVPGANAAVEGDGDNAWPFNISVLFPSQRYQQIYAASAFGSQPLLINEIAFRPDATHSAAFSTLLTDVQINLSTAATTVATLSTTFALNVGADDTIVHSGALSLSSSFTGAGPKDFDIVIALTTPFLYRPSLGDLLLDVRNSGGGFTAPFDYVRSSTETNRVYSTDGGVGSPTGVPDGIDGPGGGLVTRFNGTAVPEPGTLALLSFGGLATLRRRRRRQG